MQAILAVHFSATSAFTINFSNDPGCAGEDLGTGYKSINQSIKLLLVSRRVSQSMLLMAPTTGTSLCSIPRTTAIQPMKSPRAM